MSTQADGQGTAGKQTDEVDRASARKRLLEWLEITSKLAAPAAVLVVAYLGHTLQGSLTMSQMLSQREQSDTTIRAEMFKSISDRLFAKNGELKPWERSVYTQLLALNFHEHIELKPLLLEVDEDLSKALANEKNEDQKQAIEQRRNELRSVANRVRLRQTASLLGSSPEPARSASLYPAGAGSDVNSAADGRVRYFGIRAADPTSGKCAETASSCGASNEEGKNVCVNEPLIETSPDQRSQVSITVTEVDARRQSARVRVKPSALLADAAPQLPTEHGAPATTVGGTAVEFETTWFDFPLTDNTLLASGARYAIFIDDFCAPKDGSPPAVKLGLLWFPPDYFPARERPTNYRQLRQKLGLPAGG